MLVARVGGANSGDETDIWRPAPLPLQTASNLSNNTRMLTLRKVQGDKKTIKPTGYFVGKPMILAFTMLNFSSVGLLY